MSKIHLLAWLFLLAIAFPGAARADDMAALYQTQAIVTGQSEENRQPGFEKCFQGVLVKVSGDQRLLKTSEVIALIPKSGEFVASFRYRDRLEGIPIHDEQGTYDRPHDLTCIFDRARIDALLGKLGSRAWLDKRPTVAVFLSVKTATKAFALASDGVDGPYMRDSLAAAAEPLAIPVLLPSTTMLAAAGLDAGTMLMADEAKLAEVAKAAGADAPLAGSLEWNDAELGWIVKWRLPSGGTLAHWEIRGVSFDEGFRNAIRGAAQVLSGNGQPD